MPQSNTNQADIKGCLTGFISIFEWAMTKSLWLQSHFAKMLAYHKLSWISDFQLTPHEMLRWLNFWAWFKIASYHWRNLADVRKCPFFFWLLEREPELKWKGKNAPRAVILEELSRGRQYRGIFSTAFVGGGAFPFYSNLNWERNYLISPDCEATSPLQKWIIQTWWRAIWWIKRALIGVNAANWVNG